MHRSLRKTCSGVVVTSMLSLAASVYAKVQSITAAKAARHIGERETVYGMVAGAHFASGSRGQPTYLNFDRPYLGVGSRQIQHCP
jgi:hypothetical protein